MLLALSFKIARGSGRCTICTTLADLYTDSYRSLKRLIPTKLIIIIITIITIIIIIITVITVIIIIVTFDSISLGMLWKAKITEQFEGPGQKGAAEINKLLFPINGFHTRLWDRPRQIISNKPVFHTNTSHWNSIIKIITVDIGSIKVFSRMQSIIFFPLRRCFASSVTTSRSLWLLKLLMGNEKLLLECASFHFRES